MVYMYIYIYIYRFLSSFSDTAQVSPSFTQFFHHGFTLFVQVQGAPKLPSLEVEEAKPKAG